MTCDAAIEHPAPDTLEAMRERHHAVARYRLYYFESRKPKGRQLTEIERGLTFDEAKAKAGALNDELKSRGLDRFSDPLYGVQLTNSWQCMSEAARARHTLLGKSEADFNH